MKILPSPLRKMILRGLLSREQTFKRWVKFVDDQPEGRVMEEGSGALQAERFATRMSDRIKLRHCFIIPDDEE